MSGAWLDHLHLAEFAYNNFYHASIGMAPFVWLFLIFLRDASMFVRVIHSG
jgi:hypothetical protein